MNSNRDRVEIRFDCPYEREKEREDCSWTVIKKFDSRALISLGLFYSFAGQDLGAGDSLLFRDSYPEKMGWVAWYQITIWREQDWGREKPFITVHALFFISSNHRSEMLCVPKVTPCLSKENACVSYGGSRVDSSSVNWVRFYRGNVFETEPTFLATSSLRSHSLTRFTQKKKLRQGFPD